MIGQAKLFFPIQTREEWWYPDYVEKACPGLPSWKALRNCAKIFAKNSSDSFGTYYSGPWEKPDEARIRALGLNFKVEEQPTGEELTRKLLKAIEKNKPIVLFNWTPHWIEIEIPGKFIEFPEYTPECEKDPKWGINPTFLYDCGNPKNGWLKSAVWAGVKETWPCAYQLLKNVEMTNRDLAQMAHYAERDGLSYEKAAEKWIKRHHSRWMQWIPLNCEKLNQPK